VRDIIITLAKRFLGNALKNFARFSASAVLAAALLNLVTAIVFFLQFRQGDSYWRDRHQVDNVLGWIKVIAITAAAVLLLGAIVSSITSWEVAWAWWGAVAGLAGAVWEIWPVARYYVHRQERALHYPLT
jgi:membrane associated rhomboid family serine protease